MKFSDEPALYVTLVMAALGVVSAFGIPLTPAQSEAIHTFALAGAAVLVVGGVVIRSQVTPVAKLQAQAPTQTIRGRIGG